MIDAFNYSALPSRVRFGFGVIDSLGEEMDQLGRARALLISTPGRRLDAEALARKLGTRVAGLFAEAVMHTPTDVTRRALAAVQACAADCLISLGGGSTTGLGKAIALHTDLPQIVIPTTYAGSELTPVLGQTENGMKTTIRDLRVLPETVIYDVDLTLGLPVTTSVTSGINAIAHAVEALYARDRNPVISLLAENGITAISHALPRIVADPLGRAARADALYGAWLCGTCLGAVGMSIHHKLCHVLGGSFGLPHADVHTVILPHATAFNAAAEPAVMSRIAAALGVADAARGLFALARDNGAPTSLAAIGMKQSSLDRAADIAVANPYWNPRPIERDGIRALLDDAWFGRDWKE